MKTPSRTDLINAIDLAQEELVQHLSKAIYATAELDRDALVTVTYKVKWDQGGIQVLAAVKSKRPFNNCQALESKGETELVLKLQKEEPGQLLIVDAVPE